MCFCTTLQCFVENYALEEGGSWRSASIQAEFNFWLHHHQHVLTWRSTSEWRMLLWGMHCAIWRVLVAGDHHPQATHRTLTWRSTSEWRILCWYVSGTKCVSFLPRRLCDVATKSDKVVYVILGLISLSLCPSDLLPVFPMSDVFHAADVSTGRSFQPAHFMGHAFSRRHLNPLSSSSSWRKSSSTCLF